MTVLVCMTKRAGTRGPPDAWNHLTTRLSRRPVNRPCHDTSCAFTRKLEIREGDQDST